MFKKIKDWVWFKFIIKENEFHKSLDLNAFKMENMSKEEREKYLENLIKKRDLAHELDIKNS
jgi:hypothetical protein